MKTAFLIASTALALIATPASAQLLGGGGLGGSLGGSLGGGLGGSLGGTMGDTMGSVGSATRGTASGSASSSGSHKVDRRSGSVAAERSASGAIGGTVDQTLSTPAHTLNGSAAGNGSANAGAGGNAQLIGTDAVRHTAGSARSAVSGAAGGALNATSGTASGASGAGSSAAGSGNAAAGGAAQGGNSMLAAAGSTAANAAGAISVSPGMEIQSAKGRTIGTVREVETDAHGRIQSVLVEADGRTANLPASNFSASGDTLVSAMGSGEIKREAKKQEAGEASDSKSDKS